MDEKTYHALKLDRYSSIKLFLEDRKKYYSKYVLREDNREKKTPAIIFGSLTDCLMFTFKDLDNRFVIATAKKPSGQMGDFLDVLWDKTTECLSEDGIVTRTIDSLIEDAFDTVAYDKTTGERIAFKRPKKTVEDLIQELSDGEAGDWYREKRQSADKDLITREDLDNANKVVDNLRSNFVTRDIMNATTDNKQTVLDQLIIVFNYLELPMKSMLDRVIIDHINKYIQPYDLKTTYAVENFDYNYRTLKYYIQVATYNQALIHWKYENNLDDYTVLPMKFVVTDSTRYMNPLIYELSDDDVLIGYNGFTYNGQYNPGLNQAIKDLHWHKRENRWDISAENFRNNGRRKIRLLEQDLTTEDEHQSDNE